MLPKLHKKYSKAVLDEFKMRRFRAAVCMRK